MPGGRGSGGGQDPFEGADLSAKEPILAVSPAEQQKRFVLPQGYRIEPVLTDPDIEEPMQIAFDGNGRMYVLEIRTYMQDGDATGELDPVNRTAPTTRTASSWTSYRRAKIDSPSWPSRCGAAASGG